MSRDTLESNIVIFVGQVKKQWDKLSDDDLRHVGGHLDLLTGRIQKRYGMAKEEASLQVRKWAARIKERRIKCLGSELLSRV